MNLQPPYTPDHLALITGWSADDWTPAYNAYGWRSDWSAMCSFIISSASHPNVLLQLDSIFPAEIKPLDWIGVR